ncbi:MAG: ABC transporter ATP-binding protein [Bacillus sp. (in: firmicutes)]
MQAIEAKSITYQVGHFRLDAIDLSIPKGFMTSIIGPNGSGKSTFLKISAQLLKSQSGDIYVIDRLAKSFKNKEFAKTVAMLPQTKSNMPDLTAQELVSYGRSPHKSIFLQRGSQHDGDIVDWAMEVTGTHKHKNRPFRHLSGGEQQKVRIAMALAQKTDILLLDEPTTYLDIAHQIDLMEMLQNINQQYGITIVMVLHDLQQAAAYSDLLIAMKEGCVADFGKPKDLLTSEFLENVYNITAKVKFEDHFPLIIPKTTKKGDILK